MAREEPNHVTRWPLVAVFVAPLVAIGVVVAYIQRRTGWLPHR